MAGFLNPGNVVLTLDTNPIGDFVQEFSSSFGRLTPVAERQNFWASSVILDGGFPAQVWRHEFTVYKETNSRGLLIDFFNNLEDQVVADAAPLVMTSTPTAPTGFAIKNFGDCFLESATPEGPLLLFEAGFFTVSFIGNTKPT